MTARVLRCEAEAIPRLEPRAWRDAILRHRDEGSRLVTAFGRRGGERVILTAVLERAGGALESLRAEAEVAVGVHEITSAWPALHCFEREIHEQTGMRVAGHPWLKPLRYEGGEQADMASHPFYVVEGKEIHEVAVGPIHAGVIEPGSFRFMCEGEVVHHLETQHGYQHRGIEARLAGRDPRSLAPLLETVAGDTSVANACAHAAVVESLADASIPEEVEDGRAIALELERVAMHLATLSGMCGDIAFGQGAAAYGRLRTLAINATMRLCGSRFGRGAVRPGRVRMRFEAVGEARSAARALREQLGPVNDQLLGSRTARHRLRGTAVLSPRLAQDLGIVGVAGRAAGALMDVRHGRTAGPFHRRPIPRVVAAEGDCLARAEVRIREMDASLAWLGEALEGARRWPDGAPPVATPRPGALVVALVEGFRGEVVHAAETDGDGRLVHYKLQDPSLRNWMAVAQAMRGEEISDFPICNKSFDLSYCGHDL